MGFGMYSGFALRSLHLFRFDFVRSATALRHADKALKSLVLVKVSEAHCAMTIFDNCLEQRDRN